MPYLRQTREHSGCSYRSPVVRRMPVPADHRLQAQTRRTVVMAIALKPVLSVRWVS